MSDISEYCDNHQEEFLQFLKAESINEKISQKGNKQEEDKLNGNN